MYRTKYPLKPVQRVLVTGGAGFIGSHTVDLLLASGREVIVLDNLSSGRLLNLNMQHPDLTFIEGDVLEYPLVEKLVREVDAVLHLAAVVSVPFSVENPIYSFQVNTQGFLHVIEAIRKGVRPKRLVFASSAAVYGEACELPCRDDAALLDEALSPYAQQKLDTEHYAGLYSRLYGVNSLALRYFNVYGERQDPDSPYSGVISRFLSFYQADEPFTVFGDGMQSRDFIHVLDIAKANVLALDSAYAGVLNLATGKAETLLQLIDYIQNAGNKPAVIQYLPPRAGDIKVSYAAIEKAVKHLGFHYTVPLAEGIRQLVS